MSCRSCQGWLIPHICGVAFPPRHSPAPEKTVKKPRVFGPFRTAPFTPAREHEVARCQREPGSLRAWGLGVTRLNRPPRSAGLGALSVRCAMPVGGRLAGLRGSGCWIGIDKLASVKTRAGLPRSRYTTHHANWRQSNGLFRHPYPSYALLRRLQ